MSRNSAASRLSDERKESAVTFLDRALAWFAGHGVTVEREMTDNGSAHRSHRWRQTCRSSGLRQLRTKPYTPRTNGKAQRFIQTSPREWASAQAYPSPLAYHEARLARPLQHGSAVHRPGQPAPAIRLGQTQLLGSTEGTVPSSRPGSSTLSPGGTHT